MGGVDYHAIRCAHCGRYQVQQVKKNPQFKCTLCRKQQKLVEEHFRGPAKQCREIVQRLNKAYGDGEIGFTPAADIAPEKPRATLADKRKSADIPKKNDVKRSKNDKVEHVAKKVQSDRNEDDDLFSFETPQKSSATLKRLSRDAGSEETRSSLHEQKESARIGSENSIERTDNKSTDDDDDDDIFDDIPSPQKPRPSTSEQSHCSSSSEKPVVLEAWRRRSLTKLAKFRVDTDENLTDVSTEKITAPPSICPSSETRLRNVADENPVPPSLTEVSPQTSKASEDSSQVDSPSTPATGRDRLLKTLQKFQMTARSKRKF